MTLHVAISHSSPHDWFLGSLAEIGISLLRMEVPQFEFRNENANHWELVETNPQGRVIRVINDCPANSLAEASTTLYERYARTSRSHTVIPANHGLVRMRGEQATETIAKTFLPADKHHPLAVASWIGQYGLRNQAFRFALITSLVEDDSILPGHASQLMDALLPEAKTHWYLPSSRELATLMHVKHPQLPTQGGFFVLESPDDSGPPATLDLRTGTTNFWSDLELEPAGVLLAKRLTPLRNVCHANEAGRIVTIDDGLYDRHTGLTWQWAAKEMIWGAVVANYLPIRKTTALSLNWAALGPSIQWG